MAHQQLKLVEGMSIVCEVSKIVPHPSQQGGMDYMVTGHLSDGTCSFFIGGAATERQVLEHLQLDDVQSLVGYVARFRRKKGKRSNGTTVTLLDIDLTEEPLGVTNENVPAVQGSQPQGAAPKAAPPQQRQRQRPAALQQDAPPREEAPPQARQQRAPKADAPKAEPEVSEAELHIQKAIRRSGSLYAYAFRAARIVASQHPDLDFDVASLHAIAATIGIDAGKNLRGDKY